VKIRTYDEVDAEEVFLLNHLAFGVHRGPEFIAKRRRLDKRYSDHYGIYAVEGGRVLGQVLEMRIPTMTREGPEIVGGIAGVATHPAASRRGIARTLLEATHGSLKEDGLTLSFLLTDNMAAHGLYTSLGYRDVSFLPRAVKRVKVKRPPRATRLRKARRRDLPRLDAIHDLFVKGLLGFTQRQDRFFERRTKSERMFLGGVWVLEKDARVVGYAVSRQRHHVLDCWEVAAASARDYGALLSQMEARKDVVRVTVFPSGIARDHARLAKRGYALEPVSYQRVMAADLTGERGVDEIRHLYGVDEGRFCLLGEDDF
jgi:ribosomal protein S18 acetylase RimI-like enzyme